MTTPQPMTESAEWDERYGDAPIWSGDPNGVLVAEVTDLKPGRAFDVGCGEGADSVWLARRGWEVTGLDVSGVALERAAEHAAEAGATVTWLHSGLLGAAVPEQSFDLVSVLYPALRRTQSHDAERALLAAVAPGGVLLIVHHRLAAHDHDHDEEHNGFDPELYVLPEQVKALIGTDADWFVEVDETRPRVQPLGGAGAHHADDIVLRLRRRA